MRLQIDPTTKTIRLDEVVNMHELYGFIKKLFPNDWKEWRLDSTPIYNWVNPVTIYHDSVWVRPFDTCTGTGIYNVTVN